MTSNRSLAALLSLGALASVALAQIQSDGPLSSTEATIDQPAQAPADVEERQRVTWIPASTDSWTYPGTLVESFEFTGEWKHRVRIQAVDEYRPVGPGPHSILLDLGADRPAVEFEVMPGGQVYSILNSVTVNARTYEQIRAITLASVPNSIATSCTNYGPGSIFNRSGDCWRLIGVDPATGCRLANCTVAGGSACELTVTPSGGGSDSYGSDSSCIESGYLEPLMIFCPNGEGSVCM